MLSVEGRRVELSIEQSSRAGRLVFFFQAEDGIRDRNVTGVQTCALPIFSRQRPLAIVGCVGLFTCNDNSKSITQRRKHEGDVVKTWRLARKGALAETPETDRKSVV